VCIQVTAGKQSAVDELSRYRHRSESVKHSSFTDIQYYKKHIDMPVGDLASVTGYAIFRQVTSRHPLALQQFQLSSDRDLPPQMSEGLLTRTRTSSRLFNRQLANAKYLSN